MILYDVQRKIQKPIFGPSEMRGYMIFPNFLIITHFTSNQPFWSSLNICVNIREYRLCYVILFSNSILLLIYAEYS